MTLCDLCKCRVDPSDHLIVESSPHEIGYSAGRHEQSGWRLISPLARSEETREFYAHLERRET